MNITTQELKQLIRESVHEMLASVDTDVQGQIDAYKKELKKCLDTIHSGHDTDGDCEQRVGEINKEITEMLHDSSVSDDDKRAINMDSELDGLLGQVEKLAKGGLKETWEEAISSGDLEEAVLSEKAPPGFSEKTMHDIKSGLRKAHPNWSEKKVLSVAFATAWKTFYKNK